MNWAALKDLGITKEDLLHHYRYVCICMCSMHTLHTLLVQLLACMHAVRELRFGSHKSFLFAGVFDVT
jgi:hypothetical protein